MKVRTALASAASLTLVVGAAGCSSDEGSSDEETTTTTAGAESESDLLADAKTVANAYFQAAATNNFSGASEVSSGAAADVMSWGQAVNSIEAAADTPYSVPAEEAPNVLLEIDELTESGEAGTYDATGYMELGARPGGIDTTTTTEGQEPPENTNVFIIDMVFTEVDGELTLSDFRLDDVEYPVSQLYTSYPDDLTVTEVGGSDGTTTTAGDDDDAAEVDLALSMGFRDLDGSVQYIVTYDMDAELTDAGFFVSSGDSSTTTTRADDDLGTEGTVYADPAADGSQHGLVVFAGAFPGSAGTLRVVFEDSDGTTTTYDLEVPEPVELTPLPVNEVRDALTSSSTSSSSSSSSSSSTSTTTEDSSTTTEDSSTTTSSGSSSTTSSSSTSSSSTSTTDSP